MNEIMKENECKCPMNGHELSLKNLMKDRSSIYKLHQSIFIGSQFSYAEESRLFQNNLCDIILEKFPLKS